mgnify:CR=1 FL=1
MRPAGADLTRGVEEACGAADVGNDLGVQRVEHGVEVGAHPGEQHVVGGHDAEVVCLDKQGACLDGVVDVFGDTPSNGKAVKGGRAASDFIKHDEASVGGVVDDASRLVHLDHECGLTTGEIVIGTHPGEDAVHETDLRLGRRNEATYLCH